MSNDERISNLENQVQGLLDALAAICIIGGIPNDKLMQVMQQIQAKG